VVPARGDDLDRPAAHLLPDDVGQVDVRCGERPVDRDGGRCRTAPLRARLPRLTAVQRDRLGQAPDPEHLHPWHQPGLGDVVLRHHDPLHAGAHQAEDRGQHPGDRADSAVQTELAHVPDRRHRGRDLADGRHRELVGELERLAAEHPLRERLHEQLMLALYRSGRQADALAAYRRAREVLVEEIGVEPGPDLRELHAAMLRQDPSLAGPGAPELPPELEAAGPFVGREAEMAALHEAWDRARSGHGGVVVLAGPEGIGRTRLAAELAGEVHRQGARVTADGAALDDIAAVRRPTLVVVDPLDPVTAERLAPLTGNPVAAPVLVVATAGDGVPAGGLPGARHLPLGPLTAADVAAIAALYAPAGAEPRSTSSSPLTWTLSACGGAR